MERLKLGMGMVATAALVKLAFGDWLAPAEAIAAEPGSAACEVFTLPRGQLPPEERPRKLAEAVAAWLAAHPGQPVSMPFYEDTVHVVCVRP